MKKSILLVSLILMVFSVYSVSGALGDLVDSVNFETACASGIGVGIAFDGENLWYSCYSSTTDLYKADPVTGDVLASYDIVANGGLGALAYDADRNAIWAGWAGGGVTGQIYLIELDGSKLVDTTTPVFVATEAAVNSIDDGLAYDGEDDTLFIAADVVATIHHYDTDGTHLGSFDAHPDGDCGNSGLAIGGDLLYEGFNGCNKVVVVDKSDTDTKVFDFSTAVGDDPGFRDEDLECDTTTFADEGKHVMWSIEAYDDNFSGDLPRRAMAFEIEFGSCGEGGKPAEDGEEPPVDPIPEFGLIGAGMVLAGAAAFLARRKRN